MLRVVRGDDRRSWGILGGRFRRRIDPNRVRQDFEARWALHEALGVRDRFLSGAISAAGLAVACGQLIGRLAVRLDRASGVPDVARFAAHLDREFTAIWSFLFDPTIDATNWRAEHAIRPIVVTRKVCGGNRSWDGAESQQILASVIRTGSQRNANPHVVLASMLHRRTPSVVAELN